MNTLFVTLFAGAFAAALGPGCASVDYARADAHNREAKRLAKKGHFVKAIREKGRANDAEDDARHDPLP